MTRPSNTHPAFAAARPLIGSMRTVIRRAVRANPAIEPEEAAKRLFSGFVNEGLIEGEQWGEDLVFSLMLAEIEDMWIDAEVV